MAENDQGPGDAEGESRGPGGLSYIPYRFAHFPGAAEVEASAEAFDGSTDDVIGELVISPGLLRLRVPQDPSSLTDGDASPIGAWHPTVRDRDNLDAVASRGTIEKWSPRSRSAMARRYATLDYTPWVEVTAAGWSVVMVTLTYPADWQTVTPGASTAVRHLKAFRSRITRATGSRPYGIWKREFQRRGAPHYHLLLALPSVIGDESIQSWVSRNWYEVVDSGDPRHLLAGTGLDWAEGLRGTDPVRVARYFSAHAAPGGGANKEYQNAAPELWREAGDVGRFWGYWGLHPAERSMNLTREELVEARRVLRHLDRSRRRTRVIRVKRVRRSTGEIYYRHVRRRHVLGHLATGTPTGGSVFAANGPAAATAIARLLQQRAGSRPRPPPNQCDACHSQSAWISKSRRTHHK